MVILIPFLTQPPHERTLTGTNTFGTCFGETGLKIRPDVFRHDNCEQFFELYLSTFFIFSQKRNGKRDSSMVYIDSYVICLRGVTRYLLAWPDICADICRYLQIFMKVSAYNTIITTTMSPPPHADRALPEDRSLYSAHGCNKLRLNVKCHYWS
jgi:hypothetical protein